MRKLGPAYETPLSSQQIERALATTKENNRKAALIEDYIAELAPIVRERPPMDWDRLEAELIEVYIRELVPTKDFILKAPVIKDYIRSLAPIKGVDKAELIKDYIREQAKKPIAAEEADSHQTLLPTKRYFQPDATSKRTPTSKSLSKLLHQAGVHLDVELLHNWAEIVQTATEDVLDYESPKVKLKPGSKLPELLLRSVLDAGYGDAACRLIGRFYPSARPSALVLLMARLASGLTSVMSQEAVRAAVKSTCKHLVKHSKTDDLLWVLRLCPGQFRPPALSSLHALLWKSNTCAGLLLEYATKGWDPQLATTIQRIPKRHPEAHLRELAKLASMFLAHGHENSKFTEIAFEIYNAVCTAFEKPGHRDAFLKELSPRLLNAHQGFPAADPRTLEEWSRFDSTLPAAARLREERTPAQLRKQLHEDTKIEFTSRGWSIPKELPQQWDGLLTYLRDAALLNPVDPELVNLAALAAEAACAGMYGAVYANLASKIVKTWAQRLELMGSSPELDQLRNALHHKSSLMLLPPAPAPVAKADEPTATPQDEEHSSSSVASSS